MNFCNHGDHKKVAHEKTLTLYILCEGINFEDHTNVDIDGGLNNSDNEIDGDNFEMDNFIPECVSVGYNHILGEEDQSFSSSLHFNSHFTASASALLLYEAALCQDFDQKVNTANKLTQSGQISKNLSLSGALTKKAEEMGRSALSAFMAKEEEIQTRKMEVQERVLAQRRLSTVREEYRVSLARRAYCFCDNGGGRY
ncbi:unnamed protein product [Fraxinus pennsylvanica]|uniref:Uncharacterized protein n=1 Tax=Fraxinus pennsylvanica TaxID=56036 RepID=A0AAD2ACV3_9LAMI|nr:unnamed protein product [Fraxinus pennsylvanica]